MSKSTVRSYSRYSADAVQLLGALIRTARKERKFTSLELAERAGISRSLLQRIEKGDLKCGIGSVFEVATIVGVRLFDAEEVGLTRHIQRTEDKLTLLPKTVRKPVKRVNDDF